MGRKSKTQGAAKALLRAQNKVSERPQDDGPPEPLSFGTLTLLYLSTFAMVFVVYARSVYPSVPGGDSGEMITIAYQLGVPHPPGYPLYTMLAHVASRQAWIGGSVAYRCNLLSAVFGAAAAATLGLGVAVWSGSCGAALLAAGMYGFSYDVWLYSVQGEVFALNNLLISVILALTIRYALYREQGVAYMGAVALGLGLCNQHTVLLFGVPIVAGILYIGRQDLLTARAFLTLTVGFCLAFIPLHAYLVVAKQVNGGWGDVRNAEGFVKHLLRREYGTFQLGSTEIGEDGLFTDRMARYVGHTSSQLLYGGFGAACLAGLRAAWRDRAGALLAATFLFYIIVFTRLANLPLTPLLFGVQVRFWMQPNQIVCAWLGMGGHWLAGHLSRMLGQGSREPLLLGMAGLAIALQLGANMAANDHSQSRFVEDYGRQILDGMPKDALLLLNGDIMVNSVRYLQQCEGYRTDVMAFFVPTMTWSWFQTTQKRFFPKIVFPGTHYHINEKGGYSMLDFIEANYKRHPHVYNCGGWYSGDNSAEAAYDKYPHGLCERLVRKDQQLPLKEWAAQSAAALPRYRLPDRAKYDDTTWEFNVFQESFKANHTRAFHALMHGMSKPGITEEEKREAFAIAREGYSQVVRDHPRPTPDYMLKNTGIAFTQAGTIERTARQPEFTREGLKWFTEYVRVADKTDKDLPQIKQYIAQMAQGRL